MDEKGRAMQGRLDFCERNVKTLQQGVKALLRNHIEGCEATLDLSQRIRDTAAQEQFIDLQEDLIAIAECTKRLAEERRMIMVSSVFQSAHIYNETHRYTYTHIDTVRAGGGACGLDDPIHSRTCAAPNQASPQGPRAGPAQVLRHGTQDWM